MSDISHKFFQVQVQNNLKDLNLYIEDQYLKMKEKNWDKRSEFYDPGNHWLTYNVFHFYNQGISNLLESIRTLTIEACDYYNINFKNQNYYIHGWYNYWPWACNTDIDPDNLKYHDHGDHNPNLLHGYYCLSAEPSITHYKIDGKRIDLENKNDRAIVSKNGYPHTPGAWTKNSPRITIAYNIVPFNCLSHDLETNPQFIKL